MTSLHLRIVCDCGFKGDEADGRTADLKWCSDGELGRWVEIQQLLWNYFLGHDD